MIVFVGDRPSSRNKSKYVAFVGTPSYRRLLEWIYIMDVDISECLTCNTTDPWAYDQIMQADKVIALGRVAQKFVRQFREDFFRMPHPSPLNRHLNDEVFVRRCLKDCKVYLTEKNPPAEQETDVPPRGA